jgi:hypothetical protein
MLTNVVQRWKEHRGTYRPAREVVSTRALEVAPVDEVTAKSFVLRHHYLSSYPAARERFGLFWHERFVGVAVFSQPVNNATLACLPGAPVESLELGRLVLLDEVPANAESWLIAECFARLRGEGYVGVVSFSDPHPRTTAAGTTVHPGHVGTVYQATNGIYLGRSRAEGLDLLPDGRALTNRAKAKIRNLESGWRYCAQLLERHGAAPLDPTREDARVWLARWTTALCRRVRHPGNHKYAWTLRKRDRKHLSTSAPYPKLHWRNGGLTNE